MGWKVRVSRYQPSLNWEDGRLSGAIKVYGNLGGSLNNTTTQVLLDPWQSTTQEAYLTKSHLIFASGANKDLGSEIASVVIDAGVIKAVVLADAMPSAPIGGDLFHLSSVYGPNAVVSTLTRDVTFMQNELANITFETDIDVGFSRATITLNEHASSIGRLYSWFPGQYLEVFSPYGELCFGGIIYSVGIDGMGGQMQALGLRNTYSWYYLTMPLYPDASTTTSPAIISDILETNPMVVYSDTGISSIDPQGTWHAAQAAVGGIGPRDWNDGSFTADEILQEILAMGYYLMANDGDHVSIQIWENRIPRLKVSPRNPTIVNVQYLISNSNFGYKMQGVSLETNVAEIETRVYASYTNEDGATLRTPGAYDYIYLNDFGFKGTIFTASQPGEAEALNAIQEAKADLSRLGGPGSISISGKLKSKNGGGHVLPVYKLRAGDVVAFDNMIGASGAYRNRTTNPGVFVVGSTSYNVESGIMTITAHKPAKLRDIFNAGRER